MDSERKVYGIERLRDTWTVSEPIRKTMRGNRSKDTSPELALRKALWAEGLRGYRKHVKGLPGKPDIVFSCKKLIVFVHGCFWHGCPECTRNITPKTNAVYWKTKVDGNKARDQLNISKLEQLGYRVIVIWECLIKQNLNEAVRRVQEGLEV